MRPPEFTGGNPVAHHQPPPIHCRFNEAAGIHRRKRVGVLSEAEEGRPASMRPPEFTGGNLTLKRESKIKMDMASMRPPEFTGGNRASARHSAQEPGASMRPPEFTGGNTSTKHAKTPHSSRFNEAAGIHRRKRGTVR